MAVVPEVPLHGPGPELEEHCGLPLCEQTRAVAEASSAQSVAPQPRMPSTEVGTKTDRFSRGYSVKRISLWHGGRSGTQVYVPRRQRVTQQVITKARVGAYRCHNCRLRMIQQTTKTPKHSELHEQSQAGLYRRQKTTKFPNYNSRQGLLRVTNTMLGRLVLPAGFFSFP